MEDTPEPPPPIPAGPSDKNLDPSDMKSQILQLTLTEIKSSDSDDNPCVICLETITSPSTALPCAHSNFDFLCLLSWLQEQPFCPLCKTGVTQVRYIDTDSQKDNLYTVPPPAAKLDNRQEYIPIPEPNFTAWNNRYRIRHRNRPPVTRRSNRDVDEALERRRYIYRHNLYSLHIGSSPHTSYLPSCPPPAILSSTPHLLSKARLFLRRELQVFFPLSPANTESSRSQQNREFMLEYAIAILKTVDIQSESGAANAHTLLQDYILLPENGEDRTSLFLHELKNWMRWRGHPIGNMSLEGWDGGVQYPSLENNRSKRRTGHEDEVDDAETREERGYSWTDETGDHWRPSRPARNNRKRNNPVGKGSDIRRHSRVN
ncbi:hypothetical protein B0T21DRAFT_395686 [Apiosordaria backusii]|uniref:RING-type E3 ubiquitin transferase n=1 Tax=Apiosordaria backusii TaxID=314023 RepID=A0AA40AT55_9PEZI|nr:hypothetical protein B0T21DRAFT_395686 [Apiosordaria backusii]